MSRRKRTDDGWTRIRVICGHRGDHDPYRFGHIEVHHSTGAVVSDVDESGGVLTHSPEGIGVGPRAVRNLTCPVCRRTYSVANEHLVDAAKKLADSPRVVPIDLARVL